MEVTLQTVLFSDEICGARELFFRSRGETEPKGDRLILFPGAEIRTDTYMNLFDTEAWGKYTEPGKWKLVLEIRGGGRLRLCTLSRKEQCVILEEQLNCPSFEKKNMTWPLWRECIFLNCSLQKIWK